MSKYCPNCGNELRENAIFCDKCGSVITSETAENVIEIEETGQQKEKSNKKKWIVLLAVSGSIFIVILSIVVLMFTLPKGTVPTGNPSEEMSAAEKNSNAADNELTQEERLRNEYFFPSHSLTRIKNDVFPTWHGKGYVVEHLARSPNIFNGSKIRFDGYVSSIMQTEDANDFFVIAETDDFSDVTIKNIALKGTYQDSDIRLVQGSAISVTGDFSGVEMFDQPDGTHVEYAVLENCRFNVDKVFNLDEIKTVMASIFGEGLDIHSLKMNDSLTYYDFSRILPDSSRSEKWEFSSYGGHIMRVSYDGGNTSYDVYFDEDFKHYLAIRNQDETSVVKYYETSGKELWSKEFKSLTGHECKNNLLYLHADNELHIINKSDGTDTITPVYLPERESMQIINDIIIMQSSSFMFSSEEIIALDLNGKMLWRFSIDEDFTLGPTAVIDNELLISSVKTDDKREYYKYQRLDLQTGELVAEQEIGSWQ